MPKINIDELVEPIEVTVGGKDYTIEDISPKIAKKMAEISDDAQKAQDEGKEVVASDTEAMIGIMAEIMGADKAELSKLGMRKRLMLITQIMRTISEEVEAKNVPEVAVAGKP